MSTTAWSLPETDIFDTIRTALDDGSPAVLATVTAVEGSAYRRPGAKMLIRPDEDDVGSVTAGCLEDEVRDVAMDALEDGEPRIETWDLTGDDEVWGYGVGCNGVITVFVEPLDESYRPVLDARRAGNPVGVVTVVESETAAAFGSRARFESGQWVDSAGIPDDVLDELAPATTELVERGKAETIPVETAEGDLSVFVDGIRPSTELVIFGSGVDVTPVVELAKLVDFRVTVVSFRGGQADTERFPRADEVLSTSPRDVADLRAWDEDTLAVVMSHNFLDDRLTLERLLETPVEYIGLMGPHERFGEMLEAFAEEDRVLTDDERARIYTPIGLSLGGDSPYQIAYSIVAELLAVAHDREPQHLSRRAGPIHERVELDSDS
ncbi:XdhC family protein [Haloferax namakaokahaiae]|uniref:XdhC family protein n=1 Tax=Haloferax namakaokahaiae TaxID=1748331 RepID=A0ABD5ZD84_9EURY